MRHELGDEGTEWRQLLDAWGTTALRMELASDFTRRYPKNYGGWLVLANSFAGIARYRDARNALRKAQHLAPATSKVFVFIHWGHFYNEKNDLRRAELWYRKAAAARPDTRSHIFLGAVLAKQGRFTEAKRHHRLALRLKGDTVDEAHYNLALILRAERKYVEAERHLNKALGLDPKYAIAREALADVRSAKGLANKRMQRTGHRKIARRR